MVDGGVYQRRDPAFIALDCHLETGEIFKGDDAVEMDEAV